MDIKLSEDIRIGSLIRPQASGDFYGPRTRDGSIGSCALGAAAEARGILRSSRSVLYRGFKHVDEWDLFVNYPILSMSVICPVCNKEGSLRSLIPHLNNFMSPGSHDWTRERIADFVEKIEKREEQRLLKEQALPLEELSVGHQ